MFETLAFIALLVAFPIVSITAAFRAYYAHMLPVLLEFRFATQLIRIFIKSIKVITLCFWFETTKIIILGKYTGIHYINNAITINFNV